LAVSEKKPMKTVQVLLAEPHCDVNCVNDGGDNALILAARSSGVESALKCRDVGNFA
jgi:hypothetical protein